MVKVIFGSPVSLFGHVVTECSSSGTRHIDATDRAITIVDWDTPWTEGVPVSSASLAVRKATIYPPANTSVWWEADK